MLDEIISWHNACIVSCFLKASLSSAVPCNVFFYLINNLFISIYKKNEIDVFLLKKKIIEIYIIKDI